jgi:hypothetical protein
MVAKIMVCCASVIALITATMPVCALTSDDCEARIEKLDASDAEGEDRLFEKRAVIESCFSQFSHDKKIIGLVQECAKYEEQPVVKRQFAAECQLAAFRYGNVLRGLKTQYRK